MRAFVVAGVQPEIAAVGHLERELLVVARAPAHQDGGAAGGPERVEGLAQVGGLALARRLDGLGHEVGLAELGHRGGVVRLLGRVEAHGVGAQGVFLGLDAAQALGHELARLAVFVGLAVQGLHVAVQRELGVERHLDRLAVQLEHHRLGALGDAKLVQVGLQGVGALQEQGRLVGLGQVDGHVGALLLDVAQAGLQLAPHAAHVLVEASRGLDLPVERVDRGVQVVALRQEAHQAHLVQGVLLLGLQGPLVLAPHRQVALVRVALGQPGQDALGGIGQEEVRVVARALEEEQALAVVAIELEGDHAVATIRLGAAEARAGEVLATSHHEGGRVPRFGPRTFLVGVVQARLLRPRTDQQAPEALAHVELEGDRVGVALAHAAHLPLVDLVEREHDLAELVEREGHRASSGRTTRPLLPPLFSISSSRSMTAKRSTALIMS